MIRDIKYAWRLLLKTPGFTTLTIAVMAIGLGLAIYMFSIINMLAYKQLDIPDYDRLVIVDSMVDGTQNNGGTMYAHDYHYIKQRQKSFEVFSAYINVTSTLSDGEHAKRYEGSLIEPDAFKLLGARPLMGRVFSDDDVPQAFVDNVRSPDTSSVVIIAHQVWQDFFNADKDIIGKSVQVNGRAHTVIGVMQEGFAYPDSQSIWVPIKVAEGQDPGLGGWQLSIAAQLKPGVSLSAGHSELSKLAQQLSDKFPKTNTNITVHSRTLVQVAMDNSMIIIYSLMGATVFIMALVVTNVGNLMLARAVERSREIAIRTALGAPRARIVRQIFLETMIICAIGGFFGLVIAGWGLDISEPLFHNFGGWVFPWWTFELGIDELIASLIIVIVTALLTGLFPALKASDSDVNATLRDGTRGAQSKRSGQMTRLLVAAEIFLSSTMLITAGAMIFGVNDALNADYGIDPKGYLTARVGLTSSDYGTTANRLGYHQRLIKLLEATPGVDSATTGSAFPGRSSGREPVLIEGMENQDQRFPRTYFITTSNNYFDVLGIDILSGRAFNERDTLSSTPVVIVGEKFAHKHWPDGNAIGKRIKLNPANADEAWLTIVGISQHVTHSQPFGQEQFRSAIYVPNSQLAYQYQYVAIKTTLDPYLLQHSLNQAAANADPNIPLYHIMSLSDRLERRVGGMRFIGKLFVIFGVLALILAVAGIYGIMSRSVSQRTQEFGIRRAFGAEDQHIYQLLIKQSSATLLVGGAAGAYLGHFGIMALSGTLINLSSYYWIVTGVILPIIAFFFFVATLFPAFKTLQLEPNHALHHE